MPMKGANQAVKVDYRKSSEMPALGRWACVD